MSEAEANQSSNSIHNNIVNQEEDEQSMEPVEQKEEEPQQQQRVIYPRETSPIRDVIYSLHLASNNMHVQMEQLRETTAEHEEQLQQVVNKYKQDAVSPPSAALFQECLHEARKRAERHEVIQSSLNSQLTEAADLITSTMSRLRLQIEEVDRTQLQCEQVLKAREEEYQTQMNKKTAEKQEKKKRAEIQRRIDAENRAKKEKKKKEAALKLQKEEEAARALANKEKKAANKEAFKEAKAAKAALSRFQLNNRLNFLSAAAREEMDTVNVDVSPTKAAASSTRKRACSPIKIGLSDEPSGSQRRRHPLKDRTEFVMTIPKTMPPESPMKKLKKEKENSN